MDHKRKERWLVLRAQAGDRDALDQLLAAIQEPLYRYVRSIAGETPAADILQEAFVRIWQKIEWVREPEHFRPWAYRIASRIAFRSISATPPETGLDDLAHTAAVMRTDPVEPLFFERPVELLDPLPPACRAVLMLHYIDQLTHEEIAEVLEIPLGTVKSRHNYGLELLRQSVTSEPAATQSQRNPE